jgi:hypothetical protein
LLGAASKPELPPAYAPLRLGMSKDDAAKIDPRFVSGGSIGEKRFADVEFFTAFTDGTLRAVWLGIDGEEAQKRTRDEATKLWGAPVEGTAYDEPIFGWLNDDEGIAASLSGDRLRFSPYLKLSDLLGEVEPFVTPLLGKTKNELGQFRPDAKWAADHVDLLPTKYGEDTGFTRVELAFDKAGKITAYHYGISVELYPSKKDEIREALEKKYGKGTDAEEGNIVLRKSKPEIHIKYDDIIHEWSVNVNEPLL